VGVLDRIDGPADLRGLDAEELAALAAEIRDFLVAKVSRTGGHLGPNLGAVELTIALHRVFDSPSEPIVFDTGHQSYVHKILTGRRDRFDELRQTDGLSGYPSRAESVHDIVENSHASTSLSWADGLAKAFALRGEQRPVVAVVGDGALTGGMCWEALNNIADSDRPVIIVVNDNGRSYAPTAGGLAVRLAGLRTRPNYERLLGHVKTRLGRTPVVGPPIYDALHGLKRGVKDMLAPQGMFEDLGLKYLGPIDGHDVAALERALGLARRFGGPVIVHAVTRKGYGYAPAENDEADQMHGPGAFDPETGELLSRGGRRWTQVFADEIVALGAARPDVVAITAAMLEPVGLAEFARRYPDRWFDVGIAEQHALTSAAGLATGGLHPVVALYATFLNRAFDQLLMDVALHRLPVTVVLDRAGITGDDGASHNGMWDLAILGVVPGLRIAAPRDEPTLRAALREAVAHADGPTVVRYPKTPLGDDIPAVRHVDGVDVLLEPTAPKGAQEAEVDVLLYAIGATAADALEAAARLAEHGVSCRVASPPWITPVPAGTRAVARRARLIVTVEDGVVDGGAGGRVAQWLRNECVDTPVRHLGIPAEFLQHGKVADMRARLGLRGQDIARRVVEWAARLPAPGSAPGSAPVANGAAAMTSRDVSAVPRR
jgi:1-deoxy-D-xylulose-5-phosphate synthase